ncbi:helix-turn-helix transcriptional regulator [Dactylosporangium sp. NPDC050688]|uniref:helix-turn-helix transcriptional regulator n=1 Tax=Dactylosporangium sp. NPDC050688 TaxID=3157217 RepID=UPI0033DD9876
MSRRRLPDRLPTAEEIEQMAPGERIFHYRLIRGMSQSGLASRMRLIAERYRGLGTDRWQVYRWETGGHEPDEYTRHILAMALGVQVQDLGLAPNPYFELAEGDSGPPEHLTDQRSVLSASRAA